MTNKRRGGKQRKNRDPNAKKQKPYRKPVIEPAPEKERTVMRAPVQRLGHVNLVTMGVKYALKYQK